MRVWEFVRLCDKGTVPIYSLFCATSTQESLELSKGGEKASCCGIDLGEQRGCWLEEKNTRSSLDPLA